MIAFGGEVRPALPAHDAWLRNGATGGETGVLLEYAVPSPLTLVSFFTELITYFPSFPSGPQGPFLVPDGGTVEFQLFHNGVAVPSFLTVYAAGEGGEMLALAPVPEVFAAGDRFAVRCRTTGFELPVNGNGEFTCSVTIGSL